MNIRHSKTSIDKQEIVFPSTVFTSRYQFGCSIALENEIVLKQMLRFFLLLSIFVVSLTITVGLGLGQLPSLAGLEISKGHNASVH